MTIVGIGAFKFIHLLIVCLLCNASTWDGKRNKRKYNSFSEQRSPCLNYLYDNNYVEYMLIVSLSYLINIHLKFK